MDTRLHDKRAIRENSRILWALTVFLLTVLFIYGGYAVYLKYHNNSYNTYGENTGRILLDGFKHHKIKYA